MAVCVSASMIPSLKSDRSTLLGAASAASISHSTKLSSLSSLQFPVRTRFLQTGSARVSSSSRPRILPVVEAKKQSFSSFDDLLANSEKPLLVDFYATWCGPCQFMVPILDEVSTRLKDKIQIVKIDTEKYPSIADKYSIAALPTFIIFKDGKPCDRFEGALTADQMIDRIEAGLNVKQ
ncbi:hypothetical protein L6164_008851 [Bauhinia variegata]|uniref:Uncharacterized protein n=1 Tax=Bauhinia variegata TaxID=167791 RepID=A0ACB9PGW1_BAUVA|nr:hypothetical protein L6164_008851 [Bauhinia variegata]